MHKVRILFQLLLCGLFISSFGRAQSFEYYPNAKYDPAIPTLKQILGYDWGEHMTLHHEMEQYLNALQKAAPDRLKLIKYGETWEGRSLYSLVIGSPENINRIDAIKTGMQRLAYPQKLSASEADSLINSLPSIVWLVCGVHGNEISSIDAGLLVAYHLLAAQNDELVATTMQNSLVLIDPMQNPDGRDRFVNYFRQNLGRWADSDQQAAEHNEVWPSGRMNHYLFDMNRDWFAQTQPETRGRTRTYLEWFPQIFADLHEMNTNSTYYFAPPALPHNPNLTKPQLDWLRNFGRNHGQWFDKFRFDYYTREDFDAFYPGYGDSWPMFQGSIAMTYEQAGVFGLIARRNDQTDIHYREAIQHHFIASLSTIELTANNRQALLRYFYDYRKTAIEEGRRETIKEYIIAPGNDPNRAARLAAMLMASGIEVKRADTSFGNQKTRDYVNEQLQPREFPAGTFIVSLAQPAKRLAKTLMEKHIPQDKEFIDEQRRRNQLRQPEEFYDVTAWSLPLLFDVPCYTAEQVSNGQFSVLTEPPKPKGKLNGGRASLAYLIPWGTQAAASALADLFRQDIRIHSSDKPFKVNGTSFPAGTLIVKTKDNPADLYDRISKTATEHGVEVFSTNSAWMDEGPNFGSTNVKYLLKPRIALAYNAPTSPYSVGWIRYLIEQRYGYPVTTIRAERLKSADLSKYNVLILPDTSSDYSGVFSDGTKLREWMSNGGTLITLAGATTWLTDERIKLLPTKRERREKNDVKPEKHESTESAQSAKSAETTTEKEIDPNKMIEPKEEWPSTTPGAIIRVNIDRSHWLGFGYGETTTVIVDSNRIFTPLKLDQGLNVARYLSEDKFLASGLIWDDARRQLPNKAFLMYIPIGRGHLIAFAEDPNYRAFLDGLNLMMMNAIFLSPGH